MPFELTPSINNIIAKMHIVPDIVKKNLVRLAEKTYVLFASII